MSNDSQSSGLRPKVSNGVDETWAAAPGVTSSDGSVEEARRALSRYWGFADFLPLQAEAVAADLAGRDSLVVLPTGGGKSLCYQLPAVTTAGWTLVISPLLSLMKDQVDRLRRLGIPAAALNSSVNGAERNTAIRDLQAGRLKLLYLAPERLANELSRVLGGAAPPRSIVVDEAHCISAWGHDFRPEYRDLRRLRERFPQAAWHAFTATATPEVRQDICQQLGLRDQEVLVGSFFRPNLQYHVRTRTGGFGDLCSVLDRHRNAAGIIYAISRRRVEELSNYLNSLGYRTLPYHAGMSDADRAAAQEALVHDRIEALVATVAFGMGIDKPNVRFVIHAEMPRTLENYQQESGRAGRDGLPAECWLFYSPKDALVWERILENSPAEVREQAAAALAQVQAYCGSLVCRHRQLVGHFGQAFPDIGGDMSAGSNMAAGSCGACDVCLSGLQFVPAPLVTAQKVLSCVIRVGERFGADHVAKVLAGSNETRLTQLGHDQLSTFGLLRESTRPQIREWIEQLIAQQLLRRVGEYSVLQVTPCGRELLQGRGNVQLAFTASKGLTGIEGAGGMDARRNPIDSLSEIERSLYQLLWEWRSNTATAGGVPAHVIFTDRTLLDLVHCRPADATHLRWCYGIGAQKVEDYGPSLLELINRFCPAHQLPQNLPPQALQPQGKSTAPAQVNDSARVAWPHFEQGKSCSEVAALMGRAISTVEGYLSQFIEAHRVFDPAPWVSAEDAAKIEEAIAKVGSERLKPIFETLEGQQTYAAIRVVVACLKNRSPANRETARPAPSSTDQLATA
jgi:ATP-dependent DNA helicase RecQ